MTIDERTVRLDGDIERSQAVVAEFARLLGYHLAIIEDELRARFGDDLEIDWS